MPTNKNAMIRYQALDRCLRNRHRRFYINDLIEACNRALAEVNGTRGCKGAEGVQRRQIFNDLNFMEDPLGFGVEIERVKDGRSTYYRYAPGSKTLKDQPIKQEEVDMLHDALLLLRRFEGVPQFEWLADVESGLYTTSQLGMDNGSVVCFQHNPYLRGMKWYTVRVSPYYLKQYNNRWFLIGKHDDCRFFSNYAIDRIENVVETTAEYEALPGNFDFDEYFGDVVGVSVAGDPVEDVELHVTDKTLDYVVTKPLHESQCARPERLPDGKWKITLRVQPNYEFYSLIRSFGDGIEIVKPESMRTKMKEMVGKMAEMYC